MVASSSLKNNQNDAEYFCEGLFIFHRMGTSSSWSRDKLDEATDSGLWGLLMIRYYYYLSFVTSSIGYASSHRLHWFRSPVSCSHSCPT